MSDTPKIRALDMRPKSPNVAPTSKGDFGYLDSFLLADGLLHGLQDRNGIQHRFGGFRCLAGSEHAAKVANTRKVGALIADDGLVNTMMITMVCEYLQDTPFCNYDCFVGF